MFRSAAQPVQQRDQQKRDVDGLPDGIRNAGADCVISQIAAAQIFGDEMLHPEVHDEKDHQQGARDALEVPQACGISVRAPRRETRGSRRPER